MTRRPASGAKHPLLAALLLAGTVLHACDRADPATATEAKPPATPRPQTPPIASTPRIVALSPAIALILRDLGLGHALVGRHGFDQFSDPALPICGDQTGIDYEALLRVQPTHVLIQWGQRELPPRLTELAAKHGWQIRHVHLLTLDDIRAAAASMAREFIAQPAPPNTGDSWESHPLADQMNVAWAPRLNADGTPRIDPHRVGRVLMLYSINPPTVLGPGSFHDQLAERLGVHRAVMPGDHAAAPFMRLDAESVLKLAPDAIIVVAPRDPATGTALAIRGGSTTSDLLVGAAAVPVLGRLGQLDLPALRHASSTGAQPRVAIVDDPLAAIPGSNMVRLADTLADIFARWSVDDRRPAASPQPPSTPRPSPLAAPHPPLPPPTPPKS